VLVKVRFDAARYDEAVRGLQAASHPADEACAGVRKGTWFGDTESGHAVVLFESEEQAQQMAGTVTSGPEDPVQVEDVRVFEVHGEA
jgi:hypothetical protein